MLSSNYLKLAIFSAVIGLSPTGPARAQGNPTVVSGTGGRGTVQQSAQLGQVALLNSFDVNFGFGNDHHLTELSILPSERNQVVTTVFRDKNGDDAYSWRSSFWPMSIANATIHEVTGRCRGRCSTTVDVPAGQLFMLRGVTFRYMSEDHHVRTIGAEHGGSTLNVYLHDNNSDDEFFYRVAYALVPRSTVLNFGQAQGSGLGTGNATIPQGKIALRGFMMNFTNEDHHVSRMSIVPGAGTLTTRLMDKNADDSFSWRVQWALLR